MAIHVQQMWGGNRFHFWIIRGCDQKSKPDLDRPLSPSLDLEPLLPQELPAVQHIVASHEAFCAVTTGGRCVTWGDRKFGGDSHAVEAP